MVRGAANYGFIVRSNRTLVNALRPAFTIVTTPSPANGGLTAGDGNCTYGTPVTVSATANPNHVFVNWTENCARGQRVRGLHLLCQLRSDVDRQFCRGRMQTWPRSIPSLIMAQVSFINQPGIRPMVLDGDQYVYDSFSIAAGGDISEIHWRGGYNNFLGGAGESPVFDFTSSLPFTRPLL